MSDLVVEASEHLSHAKVALARGAWQDAREHYAGAGGHHHDPEAAEGLGNALWWLGDTGASFVARQRAYCLYRRGGDALGAARMALLLGVECCCERDAPEAARGWLKRAERLLEGIDDATCHAWVALWQAQLGLWGDDVEVAARLGDRAAEAGRLSGSVSLEKLALAHQGLALVMGGAMAATTTLSDQDVGAISADRQNLELVARSCSQLMYAWEQLKDFESIERWWAVFESLPAPWSSSWPWWLVRVQHAGALVWRGNWQRGEDHLQGAIKAMDNTRHDICAEAMVRLARLRRRQGRYLESASLLEQAACAPLRPHCEALSLLALAEVHLDRSEADTARGLVDHVVGSTRHAHCLTKVGALALVVAVEASNGKADLARQALAELQRSACIIATDGVRATVRFAEGMVAVCVEEFDTAVARLEEAVTMFERSGGGFETAQARLELAVALAGAGHQPAAVREAASALKHLAALGACREAERGQQRLPAHTAAHAPTRRSASGLTSRELEILALVAAGRDNQSIAEELTVSVRTVERHLSNVYDKLQASGRTARATAVSYVLRHGLLKEPV